MKDLLEDVRDFVLGIASIIGVAVLLGGGAGTALGVMYLVYKVFEKLVHMIVGVW